MPPDEEKGNGTEEILIHIRRYEKLAARNLLYLQAELRGLELELEDLDREDAQCDTDEIMVAMDWQDLPNSATEDDNPNGKEVLRRKLILRLRAKIKEYQKAALRNAQMLELQRPSRDVHEAFQVYLKNTDTDRPFAWLAGNNADLYDCRDDLVSLVSTRDEDRLTTFLRHRCPTFFRRSKKAAESARSTTVQSLSEYRLGVVVGSINIIVAAGLLFGSIFNLFYVNSQTKRLGIVAGYTVAFASCVGLLTNARRSEIFSACAAYAAVLVVFVSGNLGNGQSTTQ
ncbi:hypothetical protein LTR10_015525 [Elasticomyces elasticus]|uniref:DUF6594 domain-containing protein n=1 Tax=Exophiala sideris TaxID=1016849 RepID=A0ABR0JKX2_9EURO|nr:hypothetical protein LTR10_015525 [Elasticomyces elasticus]KAK5032237.1 hypothetical protein LTR13_007454 [Exophiala sideris]KAK5036235.1 hypothetical protein LTS07_001960 [Exophiala sideris]KAK5066618.1 hypothetical protein LTR69_001964 [Exophiala sideris]KAK5180440.1 hypothetical protein LTR44_007197 [Eurotiomycetes sp. CCFEE 6388]